MNTPPSPAQAAASEYARRREIALRAVSQGHWAEERAEAALAPWAAIALLAGADVPQLRESLAEQVRIAHSPWWASRARSLLADDLSPRGQWRAVLAEARDRALNRFTQPEPAGQAEADRAIPLVTLANHFGLPGWRPPSIAEGTAEPERQAA